MQILTHTQTWAQRFYEVANHNPKRIYIYMYIYIYIHIHNVYIDVYLDIHIHICTHIYIYVYIYIHMYVCECVGVCACVCVRIHICKYIHTVKPEHKDFIETQIIHCKQVAILPRQMNLSNPTEFQPIRFQVRRIRHVTLFAAKQRSQQSTL